MGGAFKPERFWKPTLHSGKQASFKDYYKGSIEVLEFIGVFMGVSEN